MLKDNMSVKGKVVVEIIDKKTGKVVDRSEYTNAFVGAGASYVRSMIDIGAISHAHTSINIYNTSRQLIKTLTGEWGTPIDTGSARQNTITATDSSTDTYTFQYEGLSYDVQTLYESNSFCNKESTAKTKGSDQSVKITWTISVAYSATPI